MRRSGAHSATGTTRFAATLAHFPAILEPLLAAPIWRFFSTETAYHLVQAENAVAASLVAIPVYLLARWLGLGRGYSYLCAAYALLIPAVSLAAENLTDLVAYPLVLTAIVVGVRALDTPSPKRQVAFLAFATLATLARTQYFVLVPAYILAALLLERRRMFREHKVAVLALIPVAIAITVAMLGFYSGVRSTTHLNAEFFKWLVLQAFLLALAAGVAIIPGAVISFVRPTHRREIVFSLLAGAFMVLLFCESAVYAANSGDFKERYLFSAMPLFALAYGVYLKRGRTHPYAVVAIVAAIVVAAARLPISAYAISTFRTDSQFLYGVSWLELRTTYGSTALAIALLATALGAFAVWTAFKGDRRGLALGAAIVVAVAATVGAVQVDLEEHPRYDGRSSRRTSRWVDAASHGPVTAIATPYSSRVFLLLALYWNPSIAREVTLDHAVPTDSLAAPDLKIDRSGAAGQHDRRPPARPDGDGGVVLERLRRRTRDGPDPVARPRDTAPPHPDRRALCGRLAERVGAAPGLAGAPAGRPRGRRARIHPLASAQLDRDRAHEAGQVDLRDRAGLTAPDRLLEHDRAARRRLDDPGCPVRRGESPAGGAAVKARPAPVPAGRTGRGCAAAAL